MALWPSPSVADLDGLLRFYAVPSEVWSAFAAAAGDPPDLRPLACLPAAAVVEATTSSTTSTGRRLTMVEAIQVGLVYRAAHRYLHLAAGGSTDTWRDPDPWGANPASGPTTSTRSSGTSSVSVAEKKVKFSSVLDQGDDTEFVLDETLNKAAFYTKFVQVMGGMPEDLEDPTLEQLAAMIRKVKVMRQPPYVDFAIWLPYAKKHLKSQKYKSFVMMQDGTFSSRMVAGPSCFQHWLLSYRVLRATWVMMDQVGLANLMQWENKIETLNNRYEDCWHLIAEADDRGRGEQMSKTLSKIKMAIDAGDPPPRGWDPSRPWEVVWRTVLNDQDYWREQVHLPAMVWMAKGSKGVAMAPDEEIIKEREKGRRDNAESSLGGDPGEVKKLSNRAKKDARKRKWAAEKEELKNLREGKGKSGKGGGGKHGGAGRGGSGNPGEEECYAWNNGNGLCGGLPPGSQCKGKVQRLHRCTVCKSPGPAVWEAMQWSYVREGKGDVDPAKGNWGH